MASYGCAVLLTPSIHQIHPSNFSYLRPPLRHRTRADARTPSRRRRCAVMVAAASPLPRRRRCRCRLNSDDVPILLSVGTRCARPPPLISVRGSDVLLLFYCSPSDDRPIATSETTRTTAREEMPPLRQLPVDRRQTLPQTSANQIVVIDAWLLLMSGDSDDK
jgi:hypothetical protein